jgi:starch-binding outer membrane protein, SusD/RagB family
MNKIKITLAIILSLTIVTSCVNDLDVSPKNPNSIMSGNLESNPLYVKQALGKVYASFIISGQGAIGDNKGPDISSGDENFFTTMRALWNCQEITTDGAINGWADIGISDLNTQTWSASNPFLTTLYQRLSLSITFANDFIRTTKNSTDPAVKQYNAEARFLRALAYYWHMDLFGNPPFTTEDDGIGKFFPKQIKRADLYNYIVSELLAIEDQLGDPKFSYPQADKAAAWMLLAKIYLNAEVYTGTAKWDSCKIYCDKVINSGKYALATNYRQNFSADNDGYKNPEMIFAWEQDGIHTQGWVGTTFIIQSSSDAKYIRSEDFHGLTFNTNWNGNRTRKDFMNILVDTIALYGNVPTPESDSLFTQCKDKRVFLKKKLSIDIPSPSSTGDYGIGVYKFTGLNSDGTYPENFSTAYACTDYPIFRYSDAFLMRAEAQFRLGDLESAKNDINRIRERAYGNNSGNITAAQVTADFILDERGREFYFEGHRRTDLVRFGKFTEGNYHWQWKGGVFEGVATSSHMNIFPIPSDEVSANPNIEQNKGY